MAVGAAIELYDSEVLKIEDVLLKLNEKVGTERNIKDFEREIKDRFADIGLIVEVNWYEYAVEGTKIEGGAMPQVTITGRVEGPEEFDYDRQRHEVVGNVLELPGQTPGELIKTDHETVKNFLDAQRGGHGHGHGHQH